MKFLSKICTVLLLILVAILCYKLARLFSLNALESKLENLLYKFVYQIYDFNVFDPIPNDKDAKYVLYECVDFCGGWADRLKGIMSAYAWALITNRQFRAYINHPCYLSKMLIPNEIYWNSRITRNGFDLQKSSNHSHYHLYAIDNQQFKKSLSELDLMNFKNDVDIIIMNTNNDWLNYFAVNPHIQKRIVDLGFEPAKFKLQYLFRQWYKKMFKLTPIMQIKYDQFLNSHEITRKQKRTKLICVQIRIGGKRGDYQYNKMTATKYFWQFIREKFVVNLNKTNEDYKVFLTTDTKHVEIEAIQEFGKKLLVIPGFYTHIDKEKKTKNDCSRVEKTILDFHFMQNCDMAVVSQSGYGKLSTMNRDEPLKDLYIFEKQSFYKVDRELENI